MKRKVVLKGPIFTMSGYGVHTNQVYLALKSRKDIDLYIIPTNWGMCSWNLNIENLNDILLCCKKNTNIEFDESYQVLLPNEWQNIAKINTGITAGFEGNYVKKEWINQINKMDHVIVPSNFSKKSFENTSKKYNIKINKNINVINEWFYPKFLNFSKKEFSFLHKTKFNKNILITGQISSNSKNDRKNIIKTINSVYTSIQDNSNIGILLKVNSGSYSYLNRLQLIDAIKNSLDKDVLMKIQVLFGYGNINEMKHLYESDKIICLVSGSKAEGWGLHLLEAAACGLPIIATDYSAYKEFLMDNFLKVNYKLIDIDRNEYAQFVDENCVQWADFDSNDMIYKIKSLINNYDFYKEKSKELKEIIKQRYSMNHIIKDYKLFFESLY